jgi:hypothetical protein
MRAVCSHGVDWWRECLKCRETERMLSAQAEHQWHGLDDWFYQRTMELGVAPGSPLAVGAGQTGKTLRVDLRSSDRVVDTDVRMSEAARNWTAAIDRVYAERVRDVLTAAHKRSRM